MVHPDAATKKLLAKSRKKIGKLRNKTTKATYFRDGWAMPVKGKITSTYGRKRILNGEDRGFHWGVDIAVPAGRAGHRVMPESRAGCSSRRSSSP